MLVNTLPADEYPQQVPFVIPRENLPVGAAVDASSPVTDFLAP